MASTGKSKAAIKRAQSQTCLGYAEREQSRRSQQKQQKQQAKKRQAPCLIYIYNINNYTYSTIIYINAPLLFSKTGVAFVAFVAGVAASKQSATSATSATNKNERKSIFAVLTH